MVKMAYMWQPLYWYKRCLHLLFKLDVTTNSEIPTLTYLSYPVQDDLWCYILWSTTEGPRLTPSTNVLRKTKVNLHKGKNVSVIVTTITTQKD